MPAQETLGRRKLAVRVYAPESLEPRLLLASVTPVVVELPVVDLTVYEQLLVEQINASRADPLATATRLGIDLNAGLTGSQLISATSKSPLAVRSPLVAAAGAHSQDMLTRDYFAHLSPDTPTPSNPTTRAAAQGYTYPVGENIAVRSLANELSTEVLATHDQLFLSAGHRANLLRGDYTDVGTGIRSGNFQYSNGTSFESLMTSELFGIGRSPAITGVAYDDTRLDNDRYDAGEQLVGLVVEAQASDGTIYRTRTGTSGAFTLDVPPGTYTLTAAGAALSRSLIVSSVAVAQQNVKVDLIVGTTATVAPTTGGTENSWTPAQVAALDSSGDGQITPRDALLVLNYLIEERSSYEATLDVTHDGLIAPIDVLQVINYLNAFGNGNPVPSQQTLDASPSLATDRSAPDSTLTSMRSLPADAADGESAGGTSGEFCIDELRRRTGQIDVYYSQL